MATAGPIIQQVDVDELAREKVSEVEKLLELSETLKPDVINSWLSILKQIITAADLHRTNDKNGNNESGANKQTKPESNESIYADYADDNEQFHAVDLTEQFASNSVKWTIRVKAFKVVHRLVQMFIMGNSNRSTTASKSSIIKHLPDLVRLSFVAATSPYDDLKIQGFEMFKFLINRFASVEEREFPGHSILEQYRTQVLSALKPAFNLDAPPYITAIASQVCCLWICRGLEKDSHNLKRTYQLMMATIEKLEQQSMNQNSKLYTESELEQERLDILGSWAQLYITANGLMNIDNSNNPCPSSPQHKNMITKTINKNSIQSDLHALVEPQLGSLINKWWEALKDYALLIMPAPRIIGTSHDNEHVYTREVALRLFAPVWYKLILASTGWLCSVGPLVEKEENIGTETGDDDIPNDKTFCDNTSKTKYFEFTCGILMKELCRYHSDQSNDKDSLPQLNEATIFTLKSLALLVNNNQFKLAFTEDLAIVQEFHTILYSILVNRTKSRSSHYTNVKSLLDQIFGLVAERMSNRISDIEYGLAYYIELIEDDLTNLRNSINTSGKGSSEVDLLKANLFLKVSRLMMMIKVATSQLTTSGEDLSSSLTKTLESILCFEDDYSVGLGFLEQLSGNLYCSEPLDEFLSNLRASLFAGQLALVENIFNSIANTNMDSMNKDKISSSISCLGAHMRYLVSILITSASKSLLKSFLKTILNLMEGLLPKITTPTSDKDDKTKALASSRVELLDLGLKHLKDLQDNCADDFEDIIDSKMGDKLEAARKRQQDIKNGQEAKRKAQIAGKLTQIHKSAKQPAKIVLKADFSNFYAKK